MTDPRNDVPHSAVRKPIMPLDIVLSCAALFVFAISLPLLELLGRNAEFFLAHASSRLDIVAVGVGLAIILPLLIASIVWAIHRANAQVGVVVLSVVIAILGGMLALRVLSATPARGLPAVLEIVIAGGIGAGISYAYLRFGTMRTFVRFTAVIPLVALILFIFGSSASQLVFASDSATDRAVIAVERPHQVVMVVFDEFPVASIMDADGGIQENVYPGFARLAEDATWFRNAVTVQQQTEHSLPAILSGNDASHDKLPTAGDYPFTVFTMLDDVYDLHVYETVSDLCPEYACENTTRPEIPMLDRWAALADDLWIVSGHLFLPDDLTDDLPPIDSTWSNFSANGGDNNKNIIAKFQELTYDNDRRDPINEVIDLVGTASEEPRLVFLHALVPHVPWEYLPSGQLYGAPGSAPGTKSPGWGSDEWLVDQAYQMHLSQVGYADNVLNDLIDSLQTAGTYDDTLVVVMADHGVIVRPDIKHRRTVTDDTIGDVAAIPLFIKPPAATNGTIDDYRAETVDILPTVADILGVNLPWSMDGVSLYSDARPTRTESRIEGSDGVVVFGIDGSEARDLAARKIQHFGSEGPFGLAPEGYRSLLGQHQDTFARQPSGNASATIRRRDAYRQVDTTGPILPAWVSGQLRDVAEQTIIAIVVNDHIAAVTKATTDKDGNMVYGAIVDPAIFVDGDNPVAIYTVSPAGTTWSLTPLT